MEKEIFFVVHNLKIGGIQKITLDTAKYYALKGHRVSILLLENKIELTIDFKCKIHTINLHKTLIIKPWLALYYVFYKILLRNLLPQSEFIWSSVIYNTLFTKFLNSQAYFDAIFINGARSMHRLASIKHDNIVYSLHLPYRLIEESSFYSHFLLKRLFSNKKIFTVSDYIRLPIQQKISELNIEIKAIETIYNPCDIEKTLRLAEEPIDFDEPYVLGVGRFTKQKRFDRLINAYHKSKITQKLVIIGDGRLKSELKSQIKELNLEDKVILKGFDLNPYKWMKNAELFILSSDYEGFGLVVTEALVCGTSVVATDCGPIDEILTGSLALGIAQKNSDDLARKIQLFIESPIPPTAENIEKLNFETIIKSQIKLAQC